MIFDVVFNQSPENMQADFGEVSVIQGPPGPPGDTTAADAAAKAAQKSAEVAQTAAQKAQAAAEASAQSAAQAAESVGGLAGDLATLKTENTALKAETARTARSLDYLWKKSKGVVYDTETVTGAGSSVTVPSGAMDYAVLRKLGGMSQRDADNNVLIDAPVDAVQVQGRNLLNPQIDGKAINIDTGLPATDARMCITDFIPVTPGDTYGMYSDFGNLGKLNVACYDISKAYTGKHPVDNLAGFKAFTIPVGTAYIRCCILMTGKDTSYLYRGVSAGTAADYTPYRLDAYPIPQAIRDLCPDYGIGVSADCYNYIDFAAKQYHHRVGQVDLWTLKFGKQDTTNGNWRFQVGFNTMLVGTTNVLTAKYTFVGDKTWYGVFGISTNGNQLQICDMAYATADDFIAAIAGQTLYYELATPEVIDLSAVWPDDDFGVLRVEAGGTINLHYPALDDGYELAVPSETEIMVDVAKVVQTNG